MMATLEDSDEAPEEFSFTVGKDELKKSIQIQNESISKAKQGVKNARRLIHERNISRKELKKKKFEEFESKRLPDDVLSSLKESLKSSQPVEKSKVGTKAKTKRSKSQNKTKKKLKGTEEIQSTEKGLDIIVQVRSLDEEEKEAESIAAKAAAFRNEALYGRVAARRVSSHELRMRSVKHRHGLKGQTFNH